MDKATGSIPESMHGKHVASTPSCVAVGTLSAADGETSVILTDERVHVGEGSGLRKVFSGILMTPNKEIHVCTALNQTLLKLDTPSAQSQVEIWANHETEPDQLCVWVSSASVSVDEGLKLLRSLEAGVLDSIECPKCHNQSVTVRFTHPRDDVFRTWFLCTRCVFKHRVQSSGQPAAYSSDRLDEQLEAYDAYILDKIKTARP